ncbi:MAG: hypothetical protein KC451_10245 [Amylibacter sp.]|jgi:hypothetical protein|nr:hypothetical protein [Amylibacter sp.]
METTVSTSVNSNSWNIEPTNAIAGTILLVLFLYLFFRHFLFILMIMDVILVFLRQFKWFPKEGKRLKTFLHWLFAMGLFVGFLIVAGVSGWLEFIPQ